MKIDVMPDRRQLSAEALSPEGLNPKANFFLVGAPRAGTTSVDRVLRDHPQVFLSPIKEPCHFCPDIAEQMARKPARMRRIESSYLASSRKELIHLSWVSSSDDYSRLFDGAAGHRIVGECSTYYLSSKIAPKSIHAYNPQARILILVRRPIDRIRSHYAMDRSLGNTDRPLLSLVEDELALGKDANWGNCHFYVGASRYSRQVAEFRRYFPPEQVCVLSFEQLVASPGTELLKLFGFLGIAVLPQPPDLPRENKSRAARFPWLHHELRGSGLKPFVNGLLKHSLSGPAGRIMKSVYYRKDVRVVSDEELEKVEQLLASEGLDRQ